jgi:type II secretory pathway pseudopilin PulG
MTVRRPTRVSALTLPEILIAGTLLLLVLSVAAELTTMAYRTFVRTSETTEVFQDQTIATDLLIRELRLCTAILAPQSPKDYGKKYYPGTQDPPLFFVRYAPGLTRDQVVSYRVDPTTRDLIRESVEIGKDFDPSDPATYTVIDSRSPRVLATKVEDFVFETVSPDEHYGAFFVKFQLEVKVGEATSRIGSGIRVKSI